MEWRSLISTQNLKLAWRRINTGRNLQYKRFFREAYLVYESAADKHIKELHKELAAKVWQPNHATRLYLPKPSGLQRPLSLLYINDQIVLQAIANIFAKKLYAKRQHVELETVFSNKLTSPKNSIFFVEQWQTTYSAFQDKCIETFDKDFKWSVHFDLSAYYDTISHDLLLSIVSHKNNASKTPGIVEQWLRTWSADNIKAKTGHGIPQGPIASNFLAEAFFLPIDLKLQKESFQYLRYVDDIRLFGRSENEVRQAAILLEQECRHRGLIPQSTKFDVRKLKSANEAMGALPSIAPTDGKSTSEKFMDAVDAKKKLMSAVGGRPQKITDKTRFRYVMYRAPKDAKILDTALRLLPRHPEHIDAFVAYFLNYGKSRRIVKAAISYLESEVPYSYVRGELWHVVARLAEIDEMQNALPMARQDSRIRKQCVALSWGVMHFLVKCEERKLIRIGKRLNAERPISRSLLAPIFPDREFVPGGHAESLLKGTLIEQLAGVRELQKRNITLNSLGIQQNTLDETCKTVLKSLGVIRRRRQRPIRDWIGDDLASMYGCKNIHIWRELLGAEYEHAHQIMIEAKARFDGAYSDWLGLQDSFLDMVVRSFFGFLVKKGIMGRLKTVDRNGMLINYGKLIGRNSEFGVEYPSIVKSLRIIHDRRNKIPGSHPYDKKGGAKNKWLTKGEQNKLVLEIKNAIDEIAKVVEQNK